ncbi:UbiA family prenyltransferase [Candidatus Micrarchaeota archaeon]|nr:UbiA family prenyltransferase [Candidatus Micrarchaeota archaeon]
MKIDACWKLVRFEHSFMLAVAVAVGEVITLHAVPQYNLLLLSILPPMLVGAASFAINDYFDLKSDRINRRMDRPLVSGEITPRNALLLSLLLFALGTLISILINFNCFLLTLSFSILACLYSFRLKDIAVIGNIYIALTMAVPFVYGSIAVADYIPAAVLLLSSIAFVSGLAREIMGTVRDIRGDRAGRGSKTLPMLIGARNSLLLSFIFYMVSIALSILPYLYIDPYRGNLSYLVPVLINDVLLAYIALHSLGKPSKQFMKASRNLSLAAMFIALLGFLGALLAH